MTHFRIGALSAFATLVLSTSAWADLTADQVWQNWKTLSEGYGQTVTVAAETREGDTLTVTGVALAAAFDGGSSAASIDSIKLRERGDGTVEITMSPQYPITLTLPDESGTPNVFNIVVDQPGLAIVASGTDLETRYDIAAPTLNLSADVKATGTPAIEAAGTLALSGLAGNYIVTTDTLSRIASTLEADSARLDLAITDPTPETGGKTRILMNLLNLASTTEGVLLPAGAAEEVSAALSAGFSTDGTFGFGSGDLSVDTEGPAETSKLTGAFGAASLGFGLNRDRLTYGLATKDVRISVVSTGIPFPELVISYADTTVDLMLPVSKSEDPQDFKALLRMVDLAVSDEVWAMFDRSSALPRDPATLVVDLTGKARWLMDLFSPEAAQSEAVPGELHALDINDLTLRAVGASLSGKGALTFDNSDTTTFEGMPLPTGKLDLTLVGANALLDRLSQTGLLPQDQVMGARMMMNMFARPGEGADTLTSTLEFKDKGFFANGQQLR